MINEHKQVQIVFVRCKEYVVVEVPIFIRLQAMDTVAGGALGKQLLASVKQVETTTERRGPSEGARKDPAAAERRQRKKAEPVRPELEPVSNIAPKCGADSEALQCPWSRWQVAATRRNESPWQLAEKQRRLAVKVWMTQRRERVREEKAKVLQGWWRSKLAARARTAASTDAVLVASWVRHAAYAAAAGKAAPVTPAGQEAPTDDQVLDAAIQRAAAEEAATRANLQPILEGATKAMRHYGKACCPSGHIIQATVAPSGTICGACSGRAMHPNVFITCVNGNDCGFISCARHDGCAPRDIVRVMRALDIKYPASGPRGS